MADEAKSGAAAGAAQGAAAGAAFGPWGALIGGVIGGALGYFSGDEKKKAKKYAAAAQAQRRRQQTMQLAVQRRDLVRQQRMARAQAVAAGASDEGVSSSAVGGAVSSINAQGKAATSYFDSMVDLDEAYQMFAKKAGKAQAKSDELMTLLGSAGSLATVAGDVYGLSKSTSAPTVNTGSYTSFNNSAAQTNMANNSAFTSFGSGLDLNRQ